MLIQMGGLTAQQLSFARNIQQSAQRMNGTLADMLSMMRMRDTDDSPQDNQAMTAFYRSGPLGDLKVSTRYFMPLLMSNAEAEFMTYRVENAISVKRGQSAMVPILQATVSYTEIVVYNGNKMPNHPLKVWDLQNTTGFALEQGPITLVGATYLGEGLMRFAGVDDNIQIPYALEFGILVTEQMRVRDKELYEVLFDAAERQVRLRHSQITEYDYHLTSRIERDITVFVERRDPTSGTFHEMPEPDFADTGHTRWAVVVPAKAEVDFTVRQRQIHEQIDDVAKWKSDQIEELNDAGMLSTTRYQLLRELVEQRERVAQAIATITRQQNAQKDIQVLQEQLRKNLTALGTSDRETTIRNQLLNDLENSENRRHELDAEIEAQQAEVEQSKIRQVEIINQIFAMA